MDKIFFSQAEADVAETDGNYELATNIYLSLWNEPRQRNSFVLSKLGKCMRKLGKEQDFLDICFPPSKLEGGLVNEYVQREICWCLYKCHISGKEGRDETQFLESAKYIRENSIQLLAENGFLNPFILTILSVAKMKIEGKKYLEALEWLKKLSVDNLSTVPGSFERKLGKNTKTPSLRERYYLLVTKALIFASDYSTCIVFCESALNDREIFSGRNREWIKDKLYSSRCKMEVDVETTLQKWAALSEKSKGWIISYHYAEACYSQNEMQRAFDGASRAISTSLTIKEEEKNLVNLLGLMGKITMAMPQYKKNSRMFFQAEAAIRSKNAWSINEELRFIISDARINVLEGPNWKEITEIVNISEKELLNNEYKGKIVNILPHECSGFIKSEIRKENIYFNSNSVRTGKMVLNAKVVFKLGKDKNNRDIAIDVEVESGKEQ